MNPGEKRALLRDLLKQRARESSTAAPPAALEYDLGQHPGYLRIRDRRDLLDRLGVTWPYYRTAEGLAGPVLRIGGRDYINFTCDSYLNLTSHPAVSAAAKAAIDCDGPTVNASRIVGGTRPIHLELERAIADGIGVPQCMLFVTGFQTNVSTIPALLGAKDIVLHDSLIHSSCLQGCILSQARRVPFPHNDWRALDELLAANRNSHPRVLIILEGLYTMDGDIPDLPRFIEVAKRRKAYLMVDEASSLGVLGRRGLGIREEFDIDPRDVDIWMGTLDKAMSSCGGYIAGCGELIENLRYSAAGFLYTLGLPSASVAAALAAWRVMLDEPRRLAELRANATLFLEYARERGLDVGLSQGRCLVPIILGSSSLAIMIGNQLFEEGIYAGSILPPAVEESAARLRFFLTSGHTEEQIRHTVDTVASLAARYRSRA